MPTLPPELLKLMAEESVSDQDQITKFPIPELELRLLRYVVAIAEELSFSRAADKLHVSQPAVSRQVRDLEELLGIKLFHRDSRGVRVARAGEVFVREARKALLHSHRAVHLAKAAEEPRTFTLGHCPYVDSSIIATLRSMPTSALRGIRLKFTSAYTATLIERLQRGELDAALVILPVDGKDIVLRRLFRDPLGVLLPASHRLAAASSVGLSDLQSTPLICNSAQLDSRFHESFRQACVNLGVDFELTHEVITFAESMSLVAEGLGFAFSRACQQRFLCGGVVFKQLEGSPLAVETAIAYSPAARRDVIRKIVSAVTGPLLTQAASPSPLANDTSFPMSA